MTFFSESFQRVSAHANLKIVDGHNLVPPHLILNNEKAGKRLIQLSDKDNDMEIVNAA